MTIILSRPDHSKIAAAVQALGSPNHCPPIDSGNRAHARAVLSGLGFPSHSFNAAPLADLRAAYYSLATNGLALVQFMLDTDQTITAADVGENLVEVFVRMDTACSGITLLVAPSPADCATALDAARAAQTQGALPLPATTTATPPAAKPAPDMAAAVAAVIAAAQAAATPAAAPLDEARIIELIKQNAQATSIRIITDTSTREIPTGLHHKSLPALVNILSSLAPSRRNVFLVGQAGSGKTTLAEQAAQAMGVPFYFNGAIDSEYKLTGFMDAQGRIVSTAFRKAYEEGGLYLFDEVDSSSASALLAFNAALSNGHMDFPNGSVKRHPDFYCLAAGNTYGNGADRIYCGRNQLDGATLDRFVFLSIGYDTKLEQTLAGNDDWTASVQRLRAACENLKIRHIISPRASIAGAELLAAGVDRDEVERLVVWKGLDSDSITKIKNAA